MSSPMAAPEKFAGFTVLPLSYNASTRHILYLREHVTKQRQDMPATFPSGRTLFVVNVPPDATERALMLLFKPCGIVERVVFDRDVWAADGTFGPVEDEDSSADSAEDAADEAEVDATAPPRKKQKLSKKKAKAQQPPTVTPLPPRPSGPRHTGACAHVVFLESAALTRALALPGPRAWPPPGAEDDAPRGLAGYAARHAAARPTLAAVKAHADSYMVVYEFNKARARPGRVDGKEEPVVDEDGFTLVTRGGAYGRAVGGGVGIASKAFMRGIANGGGAEAQSRAGGRGKKKKKKHEKEDFYKFQRHEVQRKRLEDLKTEWKKDQEKVAQLSRAKFKPY